ncbi:polysaccharide biosynthesis protein [Shimia biformata]|uniref:polysaccharide biosynthesis protein n=1 Tax=Shimia biformata TaxID=1294299 RepID=UPI001950A9AC|nr:nucleoside-diphosphate sugar epimerase/dehydratase [Shimia biformata]
MFNLSELPNLPRSTKRTIYLVADTLLIPVCLVLAYLMRFGGLPPIDGTFWLFLAVMTLGGSVLVHLLRVPQIRLHAFENRAMAQIGLLALSLMGLAIAVGLVLGTSNPVSLALIFANSFFLSSVAMRIIGLFVLRFLAQDHTDRQNVVIYGAGAAGIQLASALRQSREARPIAFVDDNQNLRGLMVAGLPVHSPRDLPKLLQRHQVERVLLAIQQIPELRRKKLISDLTALGVEVQILPSYVDMMAGNGAAKALRTVTPSELLGRDSVDLDVPEMARSFAGRVVMVTGAGGSIGAELCRQLIHCNPAEIVLFERSEFNLYKIDQELRPLASAAGIVLTTRLGSVTIAETVRHIIEDRKVDIVLHAAAYKHVPLVEHNELEGARNNVLGTRVVAEAALAAGIERFILISSDKAVRPTSIMGATKRMAELVIQDLQTRSDKTKFAMVRFGNVLGSSGSVLPLFQKQIEAGGPVTVTHREITRFFMTIPEAVRLVLLAGAYARGGDVFVLDMGEPQKIIDIAHSMIRLAGRTVKDPQTGRGDIAIKIIGLRPGEKLFEELLIDRGQMTGTAHPKILQAEENMLSEIEVAAMLKELQACLRDCDTERLRQLVMTRVEGFRPQANRAPIAG